MEKSVEFCIIGFRKHPLVGFVLSLDYCGVNPDQLALSEVN